jgi:HD-like signal output (HDOD) protein
MLNKVYLKILNEIEETGKESYTVETKFLGFNHMEIGSLIMEKWQFADNLIESTQFHHSNINLENKNKCIGIVSFANQISHSEIDENKVDFTQFLDVYKISEKKFEKIVKTGLDLQKSYLGF